MLHRWYLNRIGLPHVTPVFSAIVDVSPKQYKAMIHNEEMPGVDGGKIADFIRDLGWRSDNIEFSPSSFKEQLRRHGPFIYVDRVPPGQSVQALLTAVSRRSAPMDMHAVLITGIAGRPTSFVLRFIDPELGVVRSMDMFAFKKQYPSMRGEHKAFVIFIP